MIACERCGKSSVRTLVTPLHGERGGPMVCLSCGIDWHGTHARRRKFGRLVIKAMSAYLKAGGDFEDFNKLSLVASGFSLEGYDEADTIGAEIGDITSELLADAIELTHPDRHPAERRELATRTTQALVALRPFVFPAPKPDRAPTDPPDMPGETDPSRFQASTVKDLSRPEYPCADCADELPFYYCTTCRTIWESRRRKERERENAKQRARYRRRALRRKWSRPPTSCRICGAAVKDKRANVTYCSGKCRQVAYRRRSVARRQQARTVVLAEAPA